MMKTIVWMTLIIVVSVFYRPDMLQADSLQSRDETTDLLRAEGKVVHLGLKPLVHEVVKRNASAVTNYLDVLISKERVRVEEGVFEPVFISSFMKEKTHVPNSTEDILTRQQAEYEEDTLFLDMGVEGRVSTGAVMGLKYIDRIRNSSTIEKFRDYEDEYDKSVKLTLKQPLLKGFGRDVNRTKVDLATVESEIDENKYNQKIMELVAVTVELYWKLYGAQKIRQTWEESLVIAENSMKDIEVLAAGGRIPRTEYMEAKSAVSTIKTEFYGAKTKEQEARNQLLTLLNVTASRYVDIDIIVKDDPFGNYVDIQDRDRCVQMALDNWPEYEIAYKALEKEKIQLKQSKNQILPRLDVVGSVSTNTLDQKYENSLNDLDSGDFISWTAGIEFSIPFFDNLLAKSNYSIARMRVKQAEIELEALKKSLGNSVYSKIDALIGFQEQLREYQAGFEIRKQLLAIEKTKLQSGRISLKDLLDQEEEFVDTQRKTLSCIVNLKMAQTIFEIATGTILDAYQIDVKGSI